MPETSPPPLKVSPNRRALYIALFGFLTAVVPSCTTVLIFVLDRTLPAPPANASTVLEETVIEDFGGHAPIYRLDGEVDEELGVHRHITMTEDGSHVDVIKLNDGSWVTKKGFNKVYEPEDINMEQRVADFPPPAAK